MPSVHVDETPEEWVVRAELPGIDPQDIEVTTTESQLTVRGQVRQEQEDQQNGYFQTARRYGSFQRSFPLPPAVQTEVVTAEYRNGLLEIRLPKTEEAKRRLRRIPIAAGASVDQPAIEGETAEAGSVAGAKGGQASSPKASKASRGSRRTK